MAVHSQLTEIHAELQRIAEKLADVSIDLLARAVDSADESERVNLSNQERRLGKARRAVDKAIHELAD